MNQRHFQISFARLQIWIGGLESKTLISLLLAVLYYRYQLPRFSWLTRTMQLTVAPFWRCRHTGLATVSPHGSTTANLVAVAKTSMRHGPWCCNLTNIGKRDELRDVGNPESWYLMIYLIFSCIYLTPSRYDLVNSDKTIGWSLAPLLQTTSQVQSRAGTCEVWGFNKSMCASDAVGCCTWYLKMEV